MGLRSRTLQRSWRYVQWQECLCAEAEIIILGGQLLLYIMQLERAAKSCNDKWVELGSRSKQKIFLNLAYMTSARLIYQFSDMVKSASIAIEVDAFVSQRHLPKNYFGLLLLAMALILKLRIVHPPEWKVEKDQELAHIGLAHQILSNWSRDKLDEPGKAVCLIDVILCAEKESKSKMDRLTPGDRPGIAVLDDIITVAKEIRECGQFINAPVTHPPREGCDTDLSGIEAHDDELFFNHGIDDSLFDWNLQWGLDFFQPGEHDQPFSTV